MPTLVNSASFYQTADVSSAFDATGANILVAGIVAAGTVNSITYNGSAFTEQLNTSLAIDGAPTVTAGFLFYTLINPTTGSNTFAVDIVGAADPTWTVLFALSEINTADPIAGTDTDTNTSGSTVLTVNQSKKRPSFMLAMGSVRVLSVGNCNDVDSSPSFTEFEDSQGVKGDNNAGRWAHYGTFTGSGDKTYTGSNNYNGPDRHSDIGILLNGIGVAQNQILMFD